MIRYQQMLPLYFLLALSSYSIAQGCACVDSGVSVGVLETNFASAEHRVISRIPDALIETLGPFLWPIAFLLTYLLVDLSWMAAVQISIAGLANIGYFVVSMFALGIVVTTAARALPRIGFATGFRRLGIGLAYFGIGCAGAALTAMFIFPCNRLARPFCDKTYAGLDARLGFDWLEWTAYLHARPVLNGIATFGYQSHILQYLAAYFVFAGLRDRHRASEFFWSANLTGIITGLVSGLFPALGARTYLLHVSSPWLHDLFAARSTGPTEFVLAHTVGIVTMPSYHAALATLFIWSTRGTGMFGWIVATLNMAMLTGTPGEGGHYLVDVLAGMSIATLVASSVNRVIYSRPTLAARWRENSKSLIETKKAGH